MNREQRERYEQRLQRTLRFNPPVEIQTQTLEGSPVFFSQGLDTPFFSSQELLGTLPFLFAVFARFAVKFQRTLRFRNLNREQRKRHEQGDMGYSGHSVSESHPRFRLVFTHSSALDTDQATATKGAVFLRTLRFLFAVFARFAVRFIADTPF